MSSSPRTSPRKAVKSTAKYSAPDSMGMRVIVTTGLATLYVAGCLVALALILSMWSTFL